MDSLVLIERLDELMAEAKPIPFTREARVDRDEVYKILDRIRTTLPVEFERARWTGRQDSQVETQLRQIGASIAEVRRVQHGQAERPSAPPLTIAAAEQVREIVEAAERTAAQLEQEASVEAQKARAEAARNLKDAREESERLLCDARERAAADAADYLRRVEEATKKMLERAAAADSEINGMLARLRGSGGSVMEDLEAIMSGLTEIEVRRNGAPTEDPQKQTPARSGDEPASGVTSGGGAATAAWFARGRAHRPAHTSVEGLQDPPEPPAVRPQPRSTSAVGERPAVPAGSPQPQPSPPSAA